MKKYIPVILTVFIIPQITFAVWWNPVDWFKTKNKATPEIQTAILETKNSTSTISNEAVKDVTSLNKNDFENRAEVTEKVIIKNIPIDNPELLSQISVLKNENAMLRQQINELKDSIKKIQEVNTQPAMSAGCQSLKDSYAEIYQERTDAISAVEKELDEFKNSIVKLNSLGQAKIESYNAKIETLKSQYSKRITEAEQKFNTLCPGKELI